VGSSAEFDDLLLQVRESVRSEKWQYGEVRPLRLEPGVATMFGQSNQYLWHAVDLRPGIDDIHRNLHSSVRRRIRRAEREALTYEQGNSERLLGQFYKLVWRPGGENIYLPNPSSGFAA